MLTKENQKLTTITKQLKKEFKLIYQDRLSKLILFGSQARGEARSDSDIDILVVLTDEVNPEVNLKHIKTNLKMEMLLSKTPEMFPKEIWVHLMAYNLLRTLMWEAAQHSQVSPSALSSLTTENFTPRMSPASE